MLYKGSVSVLILPLPRYKSTKEIRWWYNEYRKYGNLKYPDLGEIKPAQSNELEKLAKCEYSKKKYKMT